MGDNNHSGVNDIPVHVHNKLEAFDESLTDVEDVLKPFLKIPITDIKEKIGDPLQIAKLDLMTAYATNSLFWAYLVTQGVNPKSHPIKDELLRIRGYINRAQVLEDKKKMARIDTHAAKRFVRNALWQPEDKDGESTEEQTQAVEEQVEDKPKKDKKRKKNDDDSSEKKVKKKKKKKTKQD